MSDVGLTQQQYAKQLLATKRKQLLYANQLKGYFFHRLNQPVSMPEAYRLALSMLEDKQIRQLVEVLNQLHLEIDELNEVYQLLKKLNSPPMKQSKSWN